MLSNYFFAFSFFDVWKKLLPFTFRTTDTDLTIFLNKVLKLHYFVIRHIVAFWLQSSTHTLDLKFHF